MRNTLSARLYLSVFFAKELPYFLISFWLIMLWYGSTFQSNGIKRHIPTQIHFILNICLNVVIIVLHVEESTPKK